MSISFMFFCLSIRLQPRSTRTDTLFPYTTLFRSGRLRQFVAPVCTPRLQSEIDIWPQVGFDLDLQPARTISLNNMYVRDVTPMDIGDDKKRARVWDELDEIGRAHV